MSRSIAIVIDPWDYPFNGTVVSTRRFVKALEAQFEFRLLGTSDPSIPIDTRMIQFTRLSIPGFNGILNSMKVPLAKPNGDLIRQSLRGIDLLHVQFPFFLGFAAISEARRLGIPVICSFHVQPENLLHNIALRSRLLAKILYKLFVMGFYNRADLVIVPSEFAARVLQVNGLKTPIKVISNGVPEQFLDLVHELRCDAGVKASFRLLSVGRLATEKQHAILLRAVARSRFRQSIQLSIVGTGPLEHDLKNLARRLHLDVCIESVSDQVLLDLYAAADLFVHAGDIELEGMSVMEAMATGNAVLVSDSENSATGRLVRHEKALFKSGDVEHLASQIDYWLSESETRLTAARANREWARQLTHSDSASQLAAAYDELLGVRSEDST